jgi:hypothetical protein
VLERVQVVVELHTASVTDPTDIHERFWRVAAEKLGSSALVGAGQRGAGARGSRRCIVSGWGRVVSVVMAVALVAVRLEPDRAVLVPLVA